MSRCPDFARHSVDLVTPVPVDPVISPGGTMYVTGSVVSVNTAVNTPPPVPTSVPASPNTVTPIKGSLSLKTAPSLSATKENNGVIDNFGDETAVMNI